MDTIRRNQIDYWQHFYVGRQGLKNRFGVRVRDNQFWAVVQVGDDEPFTFGQAHDIPADISKLPGYLRMIVDDHRLNNPASDLTEVLAGEKSFQAISDSPRLAQTEIHRQKTVRLRHALQTDSAPEPTECHPIHLKTEDRHSIKAD